MKFMNKTSPAFVIFVLFLQLKTVELLLSSNESSNTDFREFSLYNSTQKFYQLAVHRVTGIVYLSAVNCLYQLSPELELQGNISDYYFGIQDGDYNNILQIDYQQSKVISCVHAIGNMSCKIYSTDCMISQSNRTEIKLVLATDPSNTNQIKGMVFYLKLESEFSNVLIIKTKTEIYGYKMSGYDKNHTISHHTGNLVYGFQYENHDYFYIFSHELSSTKIQQKPSYVSSLRRCNFTYCQISTVTTICGDENGGYYNLVQIAHEGNPGLHLATSLGITSNNYVLFAIFSESNDMKNYANGLTHHSALCVYSMNTVKRNCDRNEASNPHTRESSVLTSPPTMAFNTPCPLTAINVAESGNCTELFLGTYDGHIKMIIMENATMAYEQVDITIEEGSPVNSNLQFSPDKEHLYVMTEHRLAKIKIPRFNCAMLLNYDDCIQSNQSTVHCGWCIFTNKCTIKHYCDQKSNSIWIRTDFREKIVFKTSGSFNLQEGYPPKIHYESQPSDFENILSNLAGLHCKISFANTELTLIVNATILHEEILGITCEVLEFSKIPMSHQASMAIVSLQTSNIQHIWDHNITFFNCDKYLSKLKCVLAAFPCYWCSKRKECMHYDAEKKAACPNGNISEIISFEPQQGPWEGGTIVTILGQNIDFPLKNTNCSIIVAGRSCKPYTNTSLQMKKIECIVEELELFQVKSGPIEIYKNSKLRVKSQQNFTYVNPEIESIHPNEGPTNGDTEITIIGKYLDAGRHIAVLIGKILCHIIFRGPLKIICITHGCTSGSFESNTSEDSNSTTNEYNITAKFDNHIRNPPANNTFKYTQDLEHDSEGFNLEPKGIISGGVEILIRNVTPTLIHQLLLQVHSTKQIFNSSCKVRNNSAQSTTWSCISPRISDINKDSIDAKNPRRMKFSLRSNESQNMINSTSTNYSSGFLLYPDPKFYHFSNSNLHLEGKNYLLIQGEHINKACQKTDITVEIGNDTCKVVSLSPQQVCCLLPKYEQESYMYEFEEDYNPLREHEYITVKIGEHFKRIVPKQKENSISNNHESNNVLLIVIYCTAALCLPVSISLICYYKFHRQTIAMNMEIKQSSSRVLKEIQQQMNKMCMETITLKQCMKEVIIENQILLDGNSSNLLRLPNISIVNSDSRLTNDTSSDREYLLPVSHKWEFSRDNLTLGKSLGQGEFGKVIQAEASGILQKHTVTTVAVKMLKDVHSDSDMVNLVSEMEIMKLIGSHDNVLQLLGCCTQDGELLVITEFARLGNLRDFLRNHLPSTGDKLSDSTLPQATLLGFAQQVSKGMEYLASRKCVHRDLATRNVLVFEDYTLKIADFGLAKDIQNKEYYIKETNGRLPVKWMAPEALIHGLYSTQSDVWSYGVLLWEIFTSGGTPYPTLQNMEELFKALYSGYRMEKPPNCSFRMYSLMQKCWMYLPEDRPSFATIVQYVENCQMSNVLPTRRCHS